MEDLKNRMSFNNRAIQTQAVWKLYTEVTKKTAKHGKLEIGAPESLEVKLLWEKCGAVENVVAKSVCHALVQLVSDNHAEFSYILNGFLNLVPSVKNLSGIVAGIGELLILQVAAAENQGHSYVCPFRLRTPPHPFITIVTNRPESWSLLQNQIYTICCHGNKSVRSQAMTILSPFLKFILLEPQQSVQYQPMRNSLHRALLQAAVQSHDEDVSNNIIIFMASVLPCSQLSDAESIAMACLYLTDILHHFGLRGSSTCLDRQIQSLIEYGLTLYNLCLQHSLEVTQLSHVLMSVADNKPKLLRTDRTVMTLATLLLSSPPDSLHSLLYLCDKVMQVDEGDSVPVSVRCLILPTLQLLATPSTQLSAHLWKSLKTLAGKIIKMVENSKPFSRKKQITDIEPTASTDSRCGFTQFIQEIDKYAKLSIHVFSNGQISVSWLTSLISSLKLTSHIPFCLTNIVCGLLTQSRSVEESKLALQVSVVIANRQAEQAVLFLHVLLYQLFRETQPDVKLEILNTVPLLATHKICVPPILKTIQSFGKLPRMKACAITMITSLWKLQDRCFPHLLKMVTEDASRNNPGTTGFDEVMLARAKTIRDVCKLRPEQHGSDLLAPLSDILDVCTGEGEAPIAALALEGLYYLCEAEVINIQSAWSVLAEKLIQDTRPAVVEKICELFSLVPLLDVKGQEYEKFIDDTVQYLWLFTNSGDNRVCGASYQALAMYKADQFKLSYLPRQVTEEFAEQALVIAKQQDPETTSVNIDDVITFVPGVCYLKLLKTVHPDVLQHYEAFLSAMVAKEVENLPRGIYHSSPQRHGAAANQGKAVSSIPGFIMAQYEKTKQPGLRPGLAAGLLFGYDPPVEVGRDGRPRKHYIISHGKNFQQMFSTLLHEVPIQPSEWHRSMLIPQAWTSFVDRLFVAVLEWRKAEIDLQLKRDHIDEDEARDNKEVAWLWVRDTLVDTIKNASRGNPTMQGNSVYALAGLAVTVNRYLTGLDQDGRKAAEDSTEYTSPSHWLTVVMDTVMSLMDINFVPKGSLLGLCQQRSVDDRLPASILAQASASVSLSQLVPALITLDVDRIYDIITFLANRLPSSPTCPDSVVLQFHAGLGLGMFLARLSEEHFADISGTKGMLQVWKNLDLLEECCFSGNPENRSGALLGLGLAVCAMCEEGKTDSRAHVSVVCEKLLMLCEKSDVTDSSYQALSVCTSCVYGAAFSSNIIQITQVNAIVDWLMSAHSSNPQITGVSLALGMLCYTLSKVGHPGIADIRRGLFVNWIKQLGQEDSSPMLKVSVLNGLMALIGSERTLIPIQSNASSLEGDLNTDDVIKMASHIVTSGNDLGIQSNSAWMLGHLYLSACAVADTRASVPSNYSYLPEQSFLRAMIDFLTEAGKLGPEFIPKEQVKVALSSLHDEIQHTLPPVNWAGILTPMIRLDFGADVSCLSLKLAVKQSCTAPTAAMFLTSWATPPLYNTLHVSCQMALFDSLSQLMICLAPNVLKTLLEQGSNHLLLEPAKRDPKLSQHILLGLCQALKVHDPPEAMVTVLHNAVEVFYCILQSPSQFAELTAIAECLGNIPDTFFDRLTEEDFLQNRQDKGCLVRCYLVAQGRQPLAVLNRCIDASFNNPQCDLDLVLKLLQHCLYQMCQSKSEFTGVLQRIQWFVELLGHIRNLATGVITLSGEVKDLSKVMDFAIEVVSSAVSLWTSSSSASLLGLHYSLLTCPDSKHNDDTDQSLGEVWRHHSGSWYLPVYIRGLEVEPWDQVLPKMIDWLVTMTTLPSSSLNSQTRDTLKASLLVLRQSTVFRKPAVWTGTYDSL